MRDHGRILGNLFIAWAAAQVIGAVVVSITRSAERPPALFWVFSVAAALLFGWAGTRLRLHDPRVRIAAIVLSALALLSFPVGTALGIYGLWALLKRRALPSA
ncbi:MAG: hypothetical protein HYZ28_08720 [Myxococcales bacterium]|nr:hypothetical protein [Myxococcales bacterium]